MTTATRNEHEVRARSRKAYQLARDFRLYVIRHVPELPTADRERTLVVADMAEQAQAYVWEAVAEHFGTRPPSALTIAAAAGYLRAEADRVATAAAMPADPFVGLPTGAGR